MKTVPVVVICAVLVLLCSKIARADGPIQLALVPPDLQLVSDQESITGLRLQIWGRNLDMTGVDIGLVHEATGNFTGVGFGLLNMVDGDMSGLQFSGFYSEARTHISGGQVGMFNRSDSVKGVQIGLVNIAEELTGFQFGLWNQVSSRENLPVIPLINANF